MGQIYIQIAGWIVGVVGVIITLCGILISYIFKRHVTENDRCQKENRSDHIRIHKRIDNLYKREVT